MIVLDITRNVCEKHGVSLFELMGSSRRNKVVEARVDLVVRLKDKGYSYPEIGVMLGGRDHTTIMSLHKKGSKKLSTG